MLPADADACKQNYGTPYAAARGPGHNLWPPKLVTEIFKLANSTNSLDLHLHTRTPVSTVESIVPQSASSDTFPRRWTLTTPRGAVSCSHIIHASNGYAPALIPALRGATGIVPVRGQIIATRADITAKDMAKVSFDSAETYWFPRPVYNATGDSDEERRGKERREKPLVIIGGARDFSATKELDTVDDTTVHPVVGAELREYLPARFPGMYEYGKEPEMEWVCCTLLAAFIARITDVCAYRRASWATQPLGTRLLGLCVVLLVCLSLGSGLLLASQDMACQGLLQGIDHLSWQS
jgi:hypothetical protein